MILEVCVDSVESAVNAERGGADRLELCGDLIVGGTTPSMALFERVRERVNIPIHVLLRPRFGDFLYSKDELEILIRQAKMFHNAGADTLVIGCLTKEGRLDMNANTRIIEAAATTPVNLHRAFDMCRNPKEALEDIIELGCTRILTSGLEANAVTGIPMLKELVEQADGRIIIMPGCGVNPKNIREIAESTGAVEFHFSGRSSYESGMIYRNSKVSMGGTVKIEEYQRDVTDPEIVKAAVNVLKQKDDIDEANEKKNKEARAKSKKKRNEFDDEDDDLD